MIKRHVNGIVYLKNREEVIHRIDSIKFDEERGDLVIYSYGFVNYLKPNAKICLVFVDEEGGAVDEKAHEKK